MDNEKLRLIIQLIGLAISLLTVIAAFLGSISTDSTALVLIGQSVQQSAGLYSVPVKAIPVCRV